MERVQLRGLTRALPLALVLMLMPTLLLAQSQFATLSGSVTDSTGAVVPNANVTVKPSNSGNVRKTVSNASGVFSVPLLPADTYDVFVAAKGFADWHDTGITLSAADSKSMHIELKVASAKGETVEVNETTTQLAVLDGGEKGATISQKDLNGLSLIGRSATEYLRILPGAALIANGAVNNAADAFETQAIGFTPDNVAAGSNGTLATGQVTINGQSAEVTLDGMNVTDVGKNMIPPVNANPDMISEVKVLTSNFTAENAKGPVVMNSEMKGGGSQFHGEAYMYARNSALNSTPHYNLATNQPNPKPPSSYYFPGGNIGGPVIIPGTKLNKNRNKLFFFDGFEYYKQQKDDGANRAFVPTPDMLNGDFSSLIAYDAKYHGDPTHEARPILYQVPNNTTNPTQAGLAIRTAGGCRITGGILSPQCMTVNTVPIESPMPPAYTLGTTPGQNYMKNASPAANADPATHDGFNFLQTYSEPMNMWQNMTREDWAISDNTKMYFSWSHSNQQVNWPGGLWLATCDWCVPAPSPVNTKDTADAISATFVHVFSPTMTAEVRGSMMRVIQDSAPSQPNKVLLAQSGFPLKGALGDMDIPAVLSWGDSIPNFGDIGHDYHPTMRQVEGLPSISASVTKVVGTHTAKFGFYFERASNDQDNWEQWQGAAQWATWAGTATQNMYADILMGVSMSDEYQQGPSTRAKVEQKIGSFFAQDDWKLSRRLTVQYGMRFEHIGKPYEPEFGMATFIPAMYDANAAGDSGVADHATDGALPYSGAASRVLFYSPRLGAAWDIFGTGKTVLRGGWGSYRAFDAFQSRAYTDPALTSSGVIGVDHSAPTWEQIDAFAITLQPGKLANLRNSSFTVVDSGNDEQPLVNSYSFSIDQKLPNKFSSEFSYVGNVGSKYQQGHNANALPIGTLNTPGFLAATNPADACHDGKGGVTINAACEQTFRPYSNYQNVTDVSSFGRSKYDSFQASLMRYTGWLTLQLNYTFAKMLAENTVGYTGDALPDHGAKWEFGISPNDRAHSLSASYIFSLPKMKAGNAFERGALGGWQFSGITQVASGAMLFSQYGNFNTSAPSGWGNVNALGTPDISLTPKLTCNPRSGLGKNQYANSACFTLPAQNELGNGNWPYLPGPMFWNTDLTVMKDFAVNEKQKVEFRFASFNPLNHALKSFNPSDSQLQLRYSNCGTSYAGCHADTGFGTATGIQGQRKLELALKYMF